MTADFRWTSLSSRPWLVALSLWLGLAAMATLALWHLRHQAVLSQGRELRLLAVAAADAVGRGLRGAEEGLGALKAELDEGRLRLDAGDTARDLRHRAGLMPLVNSLWVVDGDGAVLVASVPHLAAPSWSGFRPPVEGLAPGRLALGPPYRAAVHAEPSVPLVMRLGLPGAPQRRWLVAGVPAKDLPGALAGALPDADARLMVFRRDGTLLATAHDAEAGDTVDPGLHAVLASPQMLEFKRFADDRMRLIAHQWVLRYDVQVVVLRDLSAALSSWRQAAALTAAAMGLLLLVMAAAVHFVQRADRRRGEAQQALQAQITRAGKLESLGTLAGGVAHDFNNVLGGIVGFGEMAQDAAVPGSAQSRHIQKVLQAASRGKALVERILTFSRGGARSASVFELAPVVDEVLDLLSASLPSGVVLERVIDAPDGRLRGDATQIFEAVMNLCTNAMQAMPAGGMLTVHLDRVFVDAARVLSHTRLPLGHYLRLSVRDQGPGISPDVMERLFEPFFTTKDAQKGTGLGLAVVFGVVAESGGAIDVQSPPGLGATFTLYLPETRDDTEPIDTWLAALPVGGGRPVLVVDDEPDLVALMVEMLQRLGYVPTGLGDPAQALALLQSEPTRFTALVTDEVMPGLTGTQLTQAVRAFDADLPVLLVSGYGGALLAQRAAAAGVTRVLGKPLHRAALAAALADALYARDAARAAQRRPATGPPPSPAAT